MQVAGDYNQDGIVNVQDINSTIKVFKNLETPNDVSNRNIDINGDGVINIGDVNNVIKIYQNKQVEDNISLFKLQNSETNNAVDLYIDMSKLYQYTKTVAGIQLYVSGIQLETRIEESGENAFLSQEEKAPEVKDWFVATNTIKHKGQDSWTGPNLSIIYCEIENLNQDELVQNLGTIKLCTCKYLSKDSLVRFYNTAPYRSMVVEVSDNSILEHTFNCKAKETI